HDGGVLRLLVRRPDREAHVLDAAALDAAHPEGNVADRDLGAGGEPTAEPLAEELVEGELVGLGLDLDSVEVLEIADRRVPGQRELDVGRKRARGRSASGEDEVDEGPDALLEPAGDVVSRREARA